MATRKIGDTGARQLRGAGLTVGRGSASVAWSMTNDERVKKGAVHVEAAAEPGNGFIGAMVYGAWPWSGSSSMSTVCGAGDRDPSPNPGWVTEGVADYIRWASYEKKPTGRPLPHSNS